MTRKQYSQEFKREAERLLEQGNKEASQLARELGVVRNRLYKRKEEIDQYGEAAFSGKATLFEYIEIFYNWQRKHSYLNSINHR